MERTISDLRQRQSLPLGAKVNMTQRRILEWVNEFGENGVYASFSGGKDSTVLLHLVRQMFPDIEAVFVDTGLEYPEIKKFVKQHENVTILRPKMNFREVIQKYGYPVVSKEVSRRVQYARVAIAEGREQNHGDYQKLCGLALDKNGEKSQYNCEKWKFLLDAPFRCSSECCSVMKKNPMKQYEKETGRVPIVATMACESRLRKEHWLIHGCNAFDAERPRSQPMSFWTEQDVLQYIKENNIEICSVYGDIIPEGGQMVFDGMPCKLCTTGCDRTGCYACCFGLHLEKGKTRFQLLKETHPRLYDFCIGGGEHDSDGIWKPNKNGLGMEHVFEALNSIYGKNFIRYK